MSVELTLNTNAFTPEKRHMIADGEAGIIAAFVAVPTIWTALIAPLMEHEITIFALTGWLSAAVLAGLIAAAIRELVLARS